MSQRNFVIEPDSNRAGIRAAELFKQIVGDAIQERSCARVALSGGTTPALLYRHLAQGAVNDTFDWKAVEFFMGDERDVALDDVESNFHHAQQALLDFLPIDWTRVHPMRADAEDLSAAAEEYEKTIRRQLPANPHKVPVFDLILLGVGADGHTASLFPGCEAVNEAHKLVRACDVQMLGRSRMTFTLPLINAARNVLMLVIGQSKAGAVYDVFTKQDKSLPASHVHPAGTLHLVADAQAARLL